MRGKENLILTGRLGEVMRESAQTALSYLKSRADDLGIDVEGLEKSDIHLHVPAGATPKEGPSAGVALAVALVSMLTGRAVRCDVAMTGEITLRGRVLPVGGIRDKVLAAQRAGIGTVVLPTRNEKDLEEVPAEVRSDVAFVPVDDFDEVLEVVLAGLGKAKAGPGTGEAGTGKPAVRGAGRIDLPKRKAASPARRSRDKVRRSPAK